MNIVAIFLFIFWQGVGLTQLLVILCPRCIPSLPWGWDQEYCSYFLFFSPRHSMRYCVLEKVVLLGRGGRMESWRN